MVLARASFPIWVLPALLVAFTSFVVVAVKIGRWRDAKRYAALTGVAKQLGMHFTPHDISILSQWGGFALSPQGSFPQVTSVMRGTRGAPVIVFDLAQSVGTDKSKSWMQRTIAAFDVSATPLPVFVGEGIGSSRFQRFLEKVLGGKAIDFPDDAEFSRGYKVRGQNPDTIRRVFSADARAHLMRRGNWQFRSTGNWLLLASIGDRPKPEEFGAFLDEASDCVRLMTRVP